MNLERLLRLYVGLILFGVSTALMVRSGLGLMSWSVFHEGLSLQTGISLGMITNLVGAVVLLAWIPLKQRPGLGTISNIVVVGLALDATLAILPGLPGLPGLPELGRPAVRAALLASGVGLNGFATAAYISAGYGPGPRDGLTLGAVKATGLSVRRARLSIEIAVLGAGWLLGGAVGPGTLIHALAIGPLMQTFMRAFERRDAKRAARSARPR